MTQQNDPETFEVAFERAEKAIESLEQGDLSLEESLRQYEEGCRALKSCYARLAQTRKRVELLARQWGGVSDGDGAEGDSSGGDGDGGAEWRDAADEPHLGEALRRMEDELGATPESD